MPRRAIPILAIVALTMIFSSCSCIYFNTFHNIRESFNSAEKARKTANRDKATGSEIKQYTDAITKASKVLERHPTSSWVDDALYIIGASYYHLGEYDKSARKFKELFANFPQSEYISPSRLLYAKDKLMLEEEAEGVVLFEEILSKEHNKQMRAEAARSLGQYYFDTKEYERAIVYFQALLDSLGGDKDKLGALTFMADGYFDLYRYDKAYANYDEALKHNPDTLQLYTINFRMAQCDYFLNRFEDGLSRLDELADNEVYFDSLASIRLMMARGYEWDGDLESAISTYEKVVEENPKKYPGAIAYYELGLIYQYDLENLDRARDYYTKARDEKSGSPVYADATKRASMLTLLKQYTAADTIITRTDIPKPENASPKTGAAQTASDSPASVFDTTLLAPDTARIVIPFAPPEVEAPAVNTPATETDTSKIVIPFAPPDSPPKIVDVPAAKADTSKIVIPFAPPDTSPESAEIVIPFAPPDSSPESAEIVIPFAPPDSPSAGADATGTGEAKTGAAKSGSTKTSASKETSPKADSLQAAEAARLKLQQEIDQAGLNLFHLGELFYVDLEKPDSAVHAFSALMERYPDSRCAPQALIAMSYIYRTDFADTAKADSLLRVVLQQYPRYDEAQEVIGLLGLAGTAADTGYAALVYNRAGEFYEEFRALDSTQYYLWLETDSGVGTVASRRGSEYLHTLRLLDSAQHYFRFVADSFPASKYYDQAHYVLLEIYGTYLAPGDSTLVDTYQAFVDSFPETPYATELSGQIAAFKAPLRKYTPAKEQEEEDSTAVFADADSTAVDSTGNRLDSLSGVSRFISDEKGNQLPPAEEYFDREEVPFKYPLEAVAYNIEDKLYFHVRIDFSGDVVEVKLKNPTQSPELNTNATETVKNTKFNPGRIPPELYDHWFYYTLTVIMPQEYRQ
ncbi:MAG: tetratricopeptide repeat protein [candidate division Zixibacteria bacterium]|nr:tetratricopeptide repeat protein [candidate division Zixibacteria bacterium]